MSGSAGGNRISRAAVEKTVQDYIDKVLSKFPGFKDAKATGSYNTGTKQDFGDIDLIVHLDSNDKKLIKQELHNNCYLIFYDSMKFVLYFLKLLKKCSVKQNRL